jgi:hypothetical protein
MQTQISQIKIPMDCENKPEAKLFWSLVLEQPVTLEGQDAVLVRSHPQRCTACMCAVSQMRSKPSPKQNDTASK